MAHPVRRQHVSVRGFFILLAVVIISGAVLWSQGDLVSPLQSTTMLISMSAGDGGFAMVGEERGTPPEAVQRDTGENDDETTVVQDAAARTAPAGTMTLETLTAELAAAGVDIEQVSATMSAEGRSLENLLAVVNSGRVTVAELAARLKGEAGGEVNQPLGEGSAGLLDIRWDEFGSVAYNLWFLLAAAVVVIVIARPIGWLVNRTKRADARAIN